MNRITKQDVRNFLQTSAGRILYNIGVVAVVFVLMSMGMEVFAERPGGHASSGNPVTHYLWNVMHKQEITDLSNAIDYQQGRLYMFKRMEGDPSTWTWAQKDEYDKLYAIQQADIQHYDDLIAQYNGDSDNPSFAVKEFQPDYMPYATR